MNISKRQIGQISIAALGLVLIIAWLFIPGWNIGKILGIVSNGLLTISMAFSFVAEDKNKAKQ